MRPEFLVLRRPRGANFQLRGAGSIRHGTEAFRRDAGNGAAGGVVGSVVVRQRLDQPGPTHFGHHRIGRHLKVEGRSSKGDHAKGAIPGVMSVRVVQHHKAPGPNFVSAEQHLGGHRHCMRSESLRRRCLIEIDLGPHPDRPQRLHGALEQRRWGLRKAHFGRVRRVSGGSGPTRESSDT